MQRKGNKMVASAMPLSYHLSSEGGRNSINFFFHSQLQYKLCGLINNKVV